MPFCGLEKFTFTFHVPAKSVDAHLNRKDYREYFYFRADDLKAAII